jgi:hypothetical protein
MLKGSVLGYLGNIFFSKEDSLGKRRFNPFVVSLSNHDRIESIGNQFARTNPSKSSGRTAYLIDVSLGDKQPEK